MHSASLETEIKDGGEVLVAIAALVTEGRIPGKLSSKTKGFYEGPHCPLNKAVTEHKCDFKDLLCSNYDNVRTEILNLWKKNIPVCLEVLLTCTCKNAETIKSAEVYEDDFLLEKWYFSVNHRRSVEPPLFNFNQLMNAIRSQLYFSQLTAWLTTTNSETITSSNVRYRLTMPGETYGSSEETFALKANRHDFPLTDVGDGYAAAVSFCSMPRMSEMPTVGCPRCRGEDGLLDDRMHMACTLKGKHRCEDGEVELVERVKGGGAHKRLCGGGTSQRPKLSVDIGKACARGRLLNNNDLIDKGKLLLDAIERSGFKDGINKSDKGKCDMSESDISSIKSSGDCDILGRRRSRRDLVEGALSRGIRKKLTFDENGVDVPTPSQQARFRKDLDNAASMVFHSRTGLPLTSSPAPVRRGKTCFDFDSSINSVSAIKSALFPTSFSTDEESESEGSIVSPCSPETNAVPKRELSPVKYRRKGHAANLLGSFEESVLNGRLEPVSTVHGFTAELGASGSFVPKHLVVPVTVFFYTLGDNDKVSSPYLSHINLGKKGYNVPKSGTIQVTLFNPLGTVVKMFVIMYDLTDMPANSQTFLRQRTLYMPANCSQDNDEWGPKWLRYLIHLRFISSKSGKIYLHSDIRMIIFRKSDMDTAVGIDMSYELRSFTHMPTNPRFSPRK